MQLCFKIRFQLRQWLNLGERKSHLYVLTFSKQIPVKHRIKCTHTDALLECHLFQTFWRGIWIIFTKRLNIFLPFILILCLINQSFSSVQLLSRVWLFATPWIAARQASLSITNSWSSLRLTSIVHRVSDAIQPSHPLAAPSPPAPNPSQHQSLFQWVNSLHEVAKVLEFQL